ncbi:MAG TPA: redoxin domain-containing protein [bacterium]
MRGRSSLFAARRRAAALAAAVLLAAAPAAAQLETVSPVEIGATAPDFTLPDTTGAQVRLGDFAGRAILLTFWSCYTDTCFTTVNVFEELLAKLGPLGLVAPTVCEEIPPGLAADNYAGLLKRCSTGQKILVDPERRVRSAYYVRQLPTSVVIGPDLKILEIVRGVPALRDPGFHERLEKLVRSLPPAASR